VGQKQPEIRAITCGAGKYSKQEIEPIVDETVGFFLFLKNNRRLQGKNAF